VTCASASGNGDGEPLENLREVVERIPLRELAVNLMPRQPYAGADPLGRFICPRCGSQDHNGGSAVVVSDYLWRCEWCGIGTRYEVGDVLLRDPTFLLGLAPDQVWR